MSDSALITIVNPVTSDLYAMVFTFLQWLTLSFLAVAGLRLVEELIGHFMDQSLVC